MATSEAARHDLYTRLIELLGEDRAGTLMTYLPTYDPIEVATKSDIAGLREDLVGLRHDVDSGITSLRRDVESDIAFLRSDLAALRSEVAALDARMDERFHRLTMTLVAGLFVIVAAMAGVVVASLV